MRAQGALASVHCDLPTTRSRHFRRRFSLHGRTGSTGTVSPTFMAGREATRAKCGSKRQQRRPLTFLIFTGFGGTPAALRIGPQTAPLSPQCDSA